MNADRARGDADRETLRKAFHISYGFLALALRYLSPAGAVAMTAAAFLHNLFLLPLWAKPVLRESDHRFPGGIHLYPAAVLLSVLVFLRRPELAAAAWGVLAFGDGFATLVGRRLGGPRLPWNGRKSVAGTLAYVGFGTLAAAALLAFVSARPDAEPIGLARAVTVAVLAASAGAAVESLPLRLDDNATTPFAVLATLGLAGA